MTATESTCAAPHGSSVLVVDDDPFVRDAVLEMLAVLGARPVGAGTVSEGLARVEEGTEPFDMVIVDLSLPDATDGDSLAPWRRACPSARLVVVTGAGRAEAERRAGGGSDWVLLLKPFGMEELADCLEAGLAAPADSGPDGG